MKIIWHPEAEVELIQASRFYDQRVSGLGSEFLDAVEVTICHHRTRNVCAVHQGISVSICSFQYS